MGSFQKNNDVAKPDAAEVEHHDRQTMIPMPACIQSKSPEEILHLERRLVRKIDLRLMPAVIIMYLLNYIDRNNIASARLGGLEDDLNLKGSEYQTCVSILFVGYILMQVPSNLLLNKLGRPSIFLPVVMMVWGVISGATAGATNFTGLLVCRFFLGFVEAPYFPGCLFYLSLWYTRKELALRTALLYSGSTIAGSFSGLIGAGVIGSLDGVRGLRAWRWLFLIEGTATVLIALCAIPLLPDLPKNTKWLSEEERAYANWRLEEEAGQEDSDDGPKQGFWTGLNLAIRDVKTWILMFLLFFLIFAASVTNFFPSVVETLGYSRVNSLFLTVPPYALATILACLNAWHSDRTSERYHHITLPLYFGAAGFIIAAATTATAPRYLSMMLMLSGVYPGFVVALGWISSTVTRPPAKRAAALALITAFGNSSSIYASYMFQNFMAPRYILAMSICTAAVVLALGFATVLRVMLVRLNKQLDEAEDTDEPSSGPRVKFLI